jgi:hypothetical protein
MAGVFWGRLKTGLEWLELGKTFVDVFGGLFVGQTVKAILVRYTQISPVWITPIWLGVATLVFALLLFWGNRKKRKQSQGAEGQSTSTQITAPATAVLETQYKNVEEFYRTYDNSMLLEAEGHIRKESDQYKPGTERERFLIRTLATGALTYTFDIVWYTIFGSQLKLLHQLNARPLSSAQVKTFYDEVGAAYPNMYPNYTFGQWLAYLQSWYMVAQNGDTFYISVRGKEFLKNLVHHGRLPDGKAF